MSNHNNFLIKMNNIFVPNQAVLYKLYMPIIGYKSISIYLYLLQEHSIDMNLAFSSKTPKSFNSLLDAFDCSNEELVEHIQQLEAIGLISKYESNNNSNEPVIFLLNKNLDYSEFQNNELLLNLLKEKISKEEFLKLEFIFERFVQDSNYINVSKKDTFLLKGNNIQMKSMISLDFIYEELTKQLKTTDVIIEELVKTSIFDSLKSKELNKKQILSLVMNSISQEGSQYRVSNIVYKKNLNNLYMNSVSLSLKAKIKINRNYEIFARDADLENYKLIVNDYQIYNSENYYSLTSKNNVNLTINKMLKVLRERYLLDDSFINAIIDYTLFKNKGRFESAYVLKIAKSISGTGVERIEDVIRFLSYALSDRIGSFAKDMLKDASLNAETIKNEQSKKLTLLDILK